MNKEINDALHFLLHCALKDDEFETQREQFEIIYKYIENLQQENQKYKETFDKAIKYIEKHTNNNTEYLDVWEVREILDILKEVE